MKYSIIIPTIGRKSLKTVLKGIAECGGFEDIKPEVVVIFDGRPVDMKLSKYIKGLHLYSTDRQVYAGGARNVGMKIATGDIFIFIGDNGIPDKNWLEEIVKFHKENPESNRGLLGKVTWKDRSAFTDFMENGPQFDYKKIKKSGATWRHFYTSNVSLKKSFLKIGEIPPLEGEARRGMQSIQHSKEERMAKKGIISYSLKSPFEGDNQPSMLKFDKNFKGWGFEDSEFGYRLEQKGFNLAYNEHSVIYRLDTPDIDSIVTKTISARKNAKVFERLHPEIKILPRGLKLVILKVLILMASILGIFSQKLKWWAMWKKAWIGRFCKNYR